MCPSARPLQLCTTPNIHSGALGRLTFERPRPAPTASFRPLLPRRLLLSLLLRRRPPHSIRHIVIFPTPSPSSCPASSSSTSIRVCLPSPRIVGFTTTSLQILTHDITTAPPGAGAGQGPSEKAIATRLDSTLQFQS